jgi:hypothetical protein
MITYDNILCICMKSIIENDEECRYETRFLQKSWQKAHDKIHYFIKIEQVVIQSHQWNICKNAST